MQAPVLYKPGRWNMVDFPDPPGRALQVTTRSPGVGDHLLTLAVAAGLEHDHGFPVVSASRQHASWTSLFWPWVSGAPQMLPTITLDMNAKAEIDAARTSRWRYWSAQAGATPRLPEARPLPAAALEWAVPFAGRVVLSPFAAHENRTWPLWHWLALESLLNGLGCRCLVLDDEPDRTGAFRGDRLTGETPARVAAVIRAATCFVGNDSGMAHVAGFLRAPAVGITHPVSDRGIFELYPTVRAVAAAGLTPRTVADLVVEQVRAHLPQDFPAESFLHVLAEPDRPRSEYWLPIYSALWQTVRDLAPRTVVEIGVRAGYSSWTMADACPDAEIVGIDADADEHGGYRGAHEHAREIMAGKRWRLVLADSHTLDRLPVDAPDLAYVDGDHTEPGSYADLCLAEQSGAKTILVDDMTNLEGVRLAVRRFMAAHPHRRGRFIPSATGLYLIEGGR